MTSLSVQGYSRFAMKHAIFTALAKVRIVRRHFGLLENNIMQSTASAAGMMTGGGTVAAIPAMMTSTFEMAKTGFEISLGLTGVMTLWMGLMRVGEQGGIVKLMSRLVDPLFHRLFPEIPPGHPAAGSIMMNIAANMLGLDNAATPLGLKAMTELQEINPEKDKASKERLEKLEKDLDTLNKLSTELAAFAKDLEAITLGGYEPEENWIDDGVILRMAPLWPVLPIWKSEPKKYWERLQAGDFDWSHIAMRYWPERVKAKCKTNKSYAIAHGHEEWYEV